MKTKVRKLLSLLLCAAMMLSLFPTAFASDDTDGVVFAETEFAAEEVADGAVLPETPESAAAIDEPSDRGDEEDGSEEPPLSPV